MNGYLATAYLLGVLSCIVVINVWRQLMRKR